MIRALALTLALALPAQGAFALAPEISARPTARPAAAVPASVQVPVRIRVYFHSDFRPTARPSGRGQMRAQAPVRTTAPRQIFLVPVRYGNGGYRPEARPAQSARPKLTQAGVVITQPQVVSTGKTGKICGKPSIRGETLSRISGRLNGCGVANPVRVSSVGGVALSKPVVMDCDTAKALDKWVSKSATPTIGRLGGGLKQVNVIAGYSCRTRNSKAGAQVSEHGKGKAVDISGFTMQNGTTIAVQSGWNNRGERKLLKKLHKSACGTFGTVLGPESDRYHKDHFHFDTARHRGGAYCR